MTRNMHATRKHMWKYVLGITLLLLTGISALAQETNTVSTRFGALTVSDEGILVFKGAPVQPKVEANNSLDLSKPYSIGSADVVLVTDQWRDCLPGLVLLRHYYEGRRQS